MSRIRVGILLASSIVTAGIIGAFAGRFLVVDAPQPSDYIVVLAGDFGDVRLQHALLLIREGYGKELMIDASAASEYGRPVWEYAQEFVNKQPDAIKAHIHVCPFQDDSTQAELRQIAPCVKANLPGATRGLVVTSTFHTRRALSVARRVLPQYQWSVGAAPDPNFGVRWWQHREWAKTCFVEWQKMIWWELVGK